MTFRSRARPPGIAGIAVALAIGLLAAACGSTGPPSASPSGSPSPTPSGPAPNQTAWPTTTVESTIALGAADAEIWKAGVDLRKAADTENLELMWGAADGLATLLERNETNIPRLQRYPATKDLGDKLQVAYAALHDAATKIRDSITGGDPHGVVAGFTSLLTATRTYADVRPALADAATQAIFMKRVLVR